MPSADEDVEWSIRPLRYRIDNLVGLGCAVVWGSLSARASFPSVWLGIVSFAGAAVLGLVMSLSLTERFAFTDSAVLRQRLGIAVRYVPAAIERFDLVAADRWQMVRRRHLKVGIEFREFSNADVLLRAAERFAQANGLPCRKSPLLLEAEEP
jgi:hypothetical protein